MIVVTLSGFEVADSAQIGDSRSESPRGAGLHLQMVNQRSDTRRAKAIVNIDDRHIRRAGV